MALLDLELFDLSLHGNWIEELPELARSLELQLGQYKCFELSDVGVNSLKTLLEVTDGDMHFAIFSEYED